MAIARKPHHHRHNEQQNQRRQRKPINSSAILPFGFVNAPIPALDAKRPFSFSVLVSSAIENKGRYDRGGDAQA